MRAWLLPGYTGIPSMTFSEVPARAPAPDELLLNVQLASLNPADHYLSVGAYPGKLPFPHILGRDALGTVAAVGTSVTGIKPGDTRLLLRSDVGVTRWGTLAEQVTVPANTTVAPPPGWTPEQCAAGPLVYLTAWQALTQWGPLPDNAHILITGASGGVGTASIQLAKALGYTVTALSRSEEKSKILRDMGADHTHDPATKWRDTVKDFRRVDLAIDNIGGELMNSVIDVMAYAGRISAVGRLGGPVPSFNPASLFFRRLKIGGVAVASYTVEESQEAWRNVLQMLARSNAKPVIDSVFAFDQVPQAFKRLAEGPMGKVLIRVKDE